MVFFHDQIVRLRALLVEDRYGDLVEDWDGDLDRLTIDGVNVQPRQQDETTDATRTTIITGWRVQSAPGVDLDVVATDRIVYDGVTCRVVGEVARWPDPLTGAVHHVEFDIERKVG